MHSAPSLVAPGSTAHLRGVAKTKPSTESLDEAVARGARIRAAREAKGLSQAKLASMVGLEGGPQSISMYELGKMGLSADRLMALAEALGVSAEWIMRGREPGEPEEPADGPGWRSFVEAGYLDLFRGRGATDEQVEHARRTPFKGGAGAARAVDYVRILEDMLSPIPAPEPAELAAARERSADRPDLSDMVSSKRKH